MATKKERRLAILKDAVAQIKAKTYDATPGAVVEGGIQDLIEEIKDLSADTKEILGIGNDAKSIVLKFIKNQKGLGECEVCARGALLLSTVAKENKFEIDELAAVCADGGSYYENSDADMRLTALFPPTQLMMMETAFEGCHNLHHLGEELHDKCVAYHDDAPYDPNKRLIAIFMNAIKNGGEFKP